MNKKKFELDLSKLNDQVWEFTNHAYREAAIAVDLSARGASLAEIEAAASRHTEAAATAWQEARKINAKIWKEIRADAKKRQQAMRDMVN